MSADKINQLFWLNYAQAIKDKAKANVGPNNAFFIGSEILKGPVGGDGIPNEYTNQGIYDMANNLLAADNLFYNPSALHGYAQALQTYLNWVDLGRKPSASQDLNLYNARESQTAAQAAFDIARRKAFARFKEEDEMGLTNGLNFSSWIDNGHAPDYVAASDALVSAGSTIEEIQNQIGGPMAVTINTARSTLKKGLSDEKANEGYNMAAAMGNVLSTSELLNKQSAGQTIPKPASHLVPAYTAPGYKKFIQEAQNKSGGKPGPVDSIEFSIDTKDDTSKFNFGQVNGGASVGVSYGWLSFNASASHSETSTTLQTGSEASSVKIKITFDNVAQVQINPGAWNVDVSQYKLRDDAPADVKHLVRPTAIVVASRLGYEITFSSNVASSFDSKMKETTSAGGSMSILGIPIGLGGSGSKTTEENTHDAHWDAASKTLKVLPKDDVQTATIIGVVGEKFNIL